MSMKADFDADFGDFINELLKVDVALKKFEVDSDKAAGKLQRVADSMQGNKIAEQAAIAVTAISKIKGGVAALTDSELKRYGATIDEATQKFERMGREVPAAMASVKSALDAARAPAEALGKAGTGEFGKGMIDGTQKVTAGFSTMGAAVMGIVSGIATSITNFGINKLQEFAAAALETGGKVTDLAAKTGLTTDEVQSFSYAATMAGSSMDTVTNAVSQLSNRLIEGNNSTVGALKSVGLSIKDLQAMEPGAAFSAVAEAIAEIPDPMKQTNAAMELFGKAGLEILPAIKGGFSDAAEEAKRLGLVIDQESISALDDMGDAMDRTELRAKVAFANMAKHLEPLLRDIDRLLSAKPEQMGDIIAGMLRRQGESMWYSAQQAYNDAPWNKKLPTALLQGPKQFLGRALVGAGGLFGDYRNYDPNFDPNNPLAPMPGLEAMPIPPAKGGGTPTATAAETAALAKALAERERLVKEHDQRLAKLTGTETLKAAKQLTEDLAELANKKIPITNDAAAKAFAELWDAKKIAAQVAPEMIAGIDAALDKLATHSGVQASARAASRKILDQFAKTFADAKNSQLPQLSQMLAQGTIGGTAFQGAARAWDLTDAYAARVAPAMQLPNIGIPAGLTAAQAGIGRFAVDMGKLNREFKLATDHTGAWADKAGAVAEAFALLAQNAGGGMEKVNQGIGTFFASINASKQAVGAIGSAFGNENFGKSAGGRAMGGALAGLQMGSTFGAMAGSGTKGFMAGAASGAAAGSVGGWWGAAAGALVGGISGYFAGKKADKEARKAMDENRKALIELYGSREELIRQAERLGISESEINKNILTNAKDGKAYTATYEKLAAATKKEEEEAAKLAKTLGAVAKARGVLSKEQTKDLGAALKIGEGPKFEAASGFIEGQVTAMFEGLQGALDSGAPLSKGMVAAIGQSLPAAFAELQRSGLSTVQALKQIQPLLDSFMKNAVLAGAGSTPGFDALNEQLGILKDEKLGPMIEQAGFASQAMAALQNTGWLTQETFGGFASSVTDAFNAMILGGKGSENALAMLHQPLQNLWQLQHDFGYEVDASTQAMLDQAEAAGTVGDKWRPAEEKMAAAMEGVVERLDRIIEVFGGDMVEGAKTGAQEAGAAITEEFKKVQPVIKIRYEYDDPGAPPASRPGLPPSSPGVPAGGGTNAAQQAAGGAGVGDVYLDGDKVGYTVAKRMQGVSDFVGA